MTYQIPPDRDDPNDSEHPDGPEDDLVSKIYGPSQADMDRSWEGYETGETQTPGAGGAIWKIVVVGVSLVILAAMVLGIVGPLVGSRSGGDDRSDGFQPERVAASVLRVIDARTIVVRSGEGEQTVRLIGMESPVFGDPVHDFARRVSQSWIEGEQVLLEADQRDADEQGRLLRYVYFDNVMINALGKIETEPPNTRYDGFLTDIERQAREAEAGIWDPAYDGTGGGPNADSPGGNTEASLRSEYSEGGYPEQPTI